MELERDRREKSKKKREREKSKKDREEREREKNGRKRPDIVGLYLFFPRYLRRYMYPGIASELLCL